MHIICTCENLLRGVAMVSHLAGRNATLPILNNILLNALDGELIISATNLEVGVQARIRGKIEQAGSVAVPARLLNDYLNLLDDDRVELKVVDSTLSIVSKKHNAQVKIMPAEEYPLIPQPSKQAVSVTFSQKSLASLFEQCFFAASRDTLRPELNGVFVSLEHNAITLAATDSFRLAEIKTSLIQPTQLSVPRTAIIPIRVIQELLRIIPLSEGEDVVLTLDDNQIAFTSSTFLIVSRLVSAQYPDYQQIIPTQSKSTIIFERTELEKAIKITSLFSKTGVNDIEFDFISQKDGITLRTVNSQIGENTSFVPAQIKGGGVDRVVFNWRFFLDGLTVLDAPSAQLLTSGPDAPAVLLPYYEKKNITPSEEYLYLIMPIRQ